MPSNLVSSGHILPKISPGARAGSCCLAEPAFIRSLSLGGSARGSILGRQRRIAGLSSRHAIQARAFRIRALRRFAGGRAPVRASTRISQLTLWRFSPQPWALNSAGPSLPILQSQLKALEDGFNQTGDHQATPKRRQHTILEKVPPSV